MKKTLLDRYNEQLDIIKKFCKCRKDVRCRVKRVSGVKPEYKVLDVQADERWVNIHDAIENIREIVNVAIVCPSIRDYDLIIVGMYTIKSWNHRFDNTLYTHEQKHWD